MTIDQYLLLGIIIFSLYMYVLLDGYDIGMGMMLPFTGGQLEKKLMLKLVDTAWDGNESWLILIGIVLWGGFPGAYSSLLPANYLFFIIMIMGFILRGMGIEFQSAKKDYDIFWGGVFCMASWIVAICQGIIFGVILSRFINAHQVSPYFVISLCTLLLVLIYCVNGMAWQYLKADSELVKRSKVNGQIATLLLLFVAAVISWMYFGHLISSNIDLQPYSRSNFILAAFILNVAGYLLILLSFSKYLTGYRLPFVLCSFTNGIGILMLGVYMFPYFFPPEITIYNSIAPSSSTVRFIVIGILCCMPFVLSYNLYAVRVFRTKIKITESVNKS